MRRSPARTAGRIAAAATAAAAASLAYGTFVERRWYRVRREALPGALRPGATRPVTILHVTDTHLTPPDEPLARFVSELAALDVDLVVTTGDLAGAHDAMDEVVDLLAPLLADGTPGVAVLGSNDFYGPTLKSPHVYFTDPDARHYGQRLDTDRLRKGLVETGWNVLEDERATVETKAGLVEVAGLHDPHLANWELPPAEAIQPIEPAAVLRIGLVHAPYSGALDLLRSAGYRTVLAGHTHGGQVRVPFVGALVTNCDLPTDRARGSSRLDGGWLHVSAGLGQSQHAPFRFACRPEASYLELLP